MNRFPGALLVFLSFQTLGVALLALKAPWWWGLIAFALYAGGLVLLAWKLDRKRYPPA